MGIAYIFNFSYEEALPVLYGTNVFVPREGIDSPFIMSRLLSPTCLQLIQSMDITTLLWCDLGETSEGKSWVTLYTTLFGLIQQCFCNLHCLRLTARFPAWEKVKQATTTSHKQIDEIVASWERLAISRDWTRLEFCVPFDWHWHSALTEKAESQNRWELTVTDWYDRISLPECR